MDSLDTHLTALPPGSGAGLALVLAWLGLMWYLRACIWRFALVGLAGTALHELMHLGVGLLLRARPTSLSLVPQKTAKDRWTLGSVQFERVTLWNAAPVAMAPLLMLPLGLGVLCWALAPAVVAGNWGLAAVLAYLSASCLSAWVPSRADFEMGGVSLGLYGLLGFAGVQLGRTVGGLG